MRNCLQSQSKINRLHFPPQWTGILCRYVLHAISTVKVFSLPACELRPVLHRHHSKPMQLSPAHRRMFLIIIYRHFKILFKLLSWKILGIYGWVKIVTMSTGHKKETFHGRKITAKDQVTDLQKVFSCNYELNDWQVNVKRRKKKNYTHSRTGASLKTEVPPTISLVQTSRKNQLT